MLLFSSDCKYKKVCEGFMDEPGKESYTCKRSAEKDYCGIYRQFKAGKIKVWVRSNNV
jgi:hypothetical protein